MTRTNDEPCMVLHTRPYRETSLIVSLFSLHHGRLSVVAKGVRGGRRGRLLQPFAFIRAGWVGRGSLSTLTTFDVDQQVWLKGDQLAAGFYLIELLTRMVAEREDHPRLFVALHWALENMQEDLEAVLRSFEKLLLEEVGYGIDFQHDAKSGEALRAGRIYRFDPQAGFSDAGGRTGYPGDALLEVAQERFADPQVKKVAKRILRQALASHLGPAPLHSRRMLRTRRT